MNIRHLDENVLVAARRRISWVFDNFDEIVCSVSGGKDSTVMAHLALAEAKRRDRQIAIYFLDEEVVYQSTADQVECLMTMEPAQTNKLWLQVEFDLTNSVSANEDRLYCWEAGKHKIWMRPKKSYSVQRRMWSEEEETRRTKGRFGFYDAIDNFERCFNGAAFLVGLRAAGESPNRYRAVTKNPVDINGEKVYWATRKGENYTMYPIYDWNFHDVWRYINDERIPYSKIYDMQHRKGYPINQMRVSSLIHERSFKSICDLPEFEPKTYAKLLKRIKGIGVAQEIGRDAKAFACRKLPKNFNSWIKYRDFLLDTHPNNHHKEVFMKRFARQLTNEYVARQQVRQVVLGDWENNLPVDNKEDPREALIRYYEEVL